MKKLSLAPLALVLVLALGLAACAPTQNVPPEPVFLTFVKSAVSEGVWEGSVSGDISGALRTEALSIDDSAPVWQVEFDWIINADNPERSFVARLNGTLDSETGQVVMSGTVTSGYLLGSRVQEQAQLLDPDTLTFAGVIQVLPAP